MYHNYVVAFFRAVDCCVSVYTFCDTYFKDVHCVVRFLNALNF